MIAAEPAVIASKLVLRIESPLEKKEEFSIQEQAIASS
jgi:hypothetical protein